MLNIERTTTYERTPNISINKHINTNKNININNRTVNNNNQLHHNLQTNVFDPLNCSPPNEFKIKLYILFSEIYDNGEFTLENDHEKYCRW